jgi:hypothetical protein
VHDYLGMTFDFSDGEVKITMKGYINEMLDKVRDDMGGEAATPAGNHSFMLSDEPKLLNEDDSDMFHHHTAKLLFLSKRARPDVLTAVAFLTTRVVRSPDEDDYKKLARCMQYLRGTLNLPLRMESDDMHVVKWWVDASFGIYADMKSHIVATMSLGKGSAYSKSIRQKLYTKSSTEAELVFSVEGVGWRMCSKIHR